MKHKQLISFFVSILLFPFATMAVSASQKQMTVAELALYKGADRQPLLEEGARKEGKLSFYTSGILTQAVRPVVNAFEKKYPFIKVEIWRAGTQAILPRIMEEYRAGKHYFDVVESTQATHMFLQQLAIAQAFYSPSLASIEEGAVTRAPGEGALAAAFRESGIGLGYNTKLITRQQVPKTYQDLLDPQWKGKGTLSSSDSGHRLVGTLLNTYGEDFIKRLAEQNFAVHSVAAAALINLVINGEYALSPTIYDSHATNNKRKGAPVDWVPLEPVQVNIGQIAMSKQSSHPHAALLFIDFELSKEAAELHKKTGYSSPRKDVPGSAKYKKFYGAKSPEEEAKWQALFKKMFMSK